VRHTAELPGDEADGLMHKTTCSISMIQGPNSQGWAVRYDIEPSAPARAVIQIKLSIVCTSQAHHRTRAWWNRKGGYFLNEL